MRDRESGFTLLEMMVTVAVIGILAAIALPSFFGETRKTKAFSEVQPMFNDLRVRLEQFLQENGKYPPTLGETTFHPSSNPGANKVAINPLPQPWLDLRVRLSGNDEVYCRYTWATGRADTNTNVGPQAALAPPAGFGFVAPKTDWYYLLAKCDMDGDNKPSWYLSTSVDPTILKVDEGE